MISRSHEIFLFAYEISKLNLNTHKFIETMENNEIIYLKCCECGLCVFPPDNDINFYTTFEMHENYSCAEYQIREIIE